MPMSLLVSPSSRCREHVPATRPGASADQRAVGTIRVGIAHGQRLVRAGLRVLLDHEAGIAVVDEAATGDEAVALTRRLQPDVVLLDVGLPGLGCVEVTRRILAAAPSP